LTLSVAERVMTGSRTPRAALRTVCALDAAPTRGDAMHGTTRYQVAVLLAAALTACGGGRPAQGSGTLRVTGGVKPLTAAAAGAAAATSSRVVKVTLTLKAHAVGLPDVVGDAVPDANGRFSLAFLDVPTGGGREISAQAFDALGNVLFEGGATDLRIVDDGTTEVILMLEQTDASKVILDEWPPFIESVRAANGFTVKSGDVVPLTVVATEGPDPAAAAALSYAWTNTNHNGTFSDPTRRDTEFTAPIAVSEPVFSDLTVTVTDAQGNKAALSFRLTVVPGLGDVTVTEVAFSNAPVATRIRISTPGDVIPDVGVPVTMVVDAADADGDPVWIGFVSGCAGTVAPAILASPGSMGILSGEPITFTPSESPSGGVCDFTFILCSGDYTKGTYAYNSASAHIQMRAR
jgi:hypothetical protein